MDQRMQGEKVVLVTGAASGIGEACVLDLAKSGFHVFAGVRRPADGVALAQKAQGHVSWLLLDITDPWSIDAAVQQIQATVETGNSLAGIVNNAGIGGIGPLEFLPPDDLRQLLEVNVVGSLTVTQAFLPLLRHSHGRIITIGSISGCLVLPFSGGYSVSKFALEALIEELRIELRPWHLCVSIIDPGGITTPMWSKAVAAVDQLTQTLPPQAKTYYAPLWPRLRQLATRWSTHGTPPSRVSHAVLHALTAPHPKYRYFVGRRANHLMRLLAALPQPVRAMLIASQFPHI